METAQCGFCGASRPAGEVVRGHKSAICGDCVGKGLNAIIASRVHGPGREIPEADTVCTFCSKKAPGSALFAGREGTGICSSCLGRGYWFVAENSELQRRQRTWSFLDDASPASLVREHFDGVELER